MRGPYHGACFCGAVEIEVSGEPNAMGYCHCRSCRSWSGGLVDFPKEFGGSGDMVPE